MTKPDSKAAAPAAPQFFLVRSMSPRGSFRRAGLQFDNLTWQPIRLARDGEESNLLADVPTLTAVDVARIRGECVPTQFEYLRILAAVEADPERKARMLTEALELEELRREKPDNPQWRRVAMLACMPATPGDIEAFLANRSMASLPVDKQLELERARNADLEARLIQLEFAAAKPAAKPGKDRP